MAQIAPGGGNARTGGGSFSAHPLCCYDYPITTDVATGLTVVDMCPPNPDRVYLAFINLHSTALVTVSPQGTEPTLTVGYNVPNLSYPLEFNREDHGPIVTAGWRGHGGAAGHTTVVQVMKHCAEDIRECNKQLPSVLYDRPQSSLALNPDHGFLIDFRKPKAQGASAISAAIESVLNLDRTRPGSFRHRVYSIPRGQASRPLRNLRLKH